MRQLSRVLPILLLPLLITGCRYKGWESFYSATTSADKRNEADPTGDNKIKGDPGSFGGIAGANGGLTAQTNYGAGANVNSTAKVNSVYDQPEKGSGQEPGEYPVTAAPGYGEDNGPALQPQPGSVGDIGAPLAHG